MGDHNLIKYAYKIFILGVCLNQFFAQLEFFVMDDEIKDPPKEQNISFERINLLLIHNLIIIPLLVRVFCLGESIKYNYHHITRKFYDENFQNEIDEHFKKKYYTRNFYYFGMFILPLAIVYILFIILLSIQYTECAIDAFIYSQYNIHPFCNGKEIPTNEIKNYQITGTLIANFYLMIEMFLFLYLMFRVFKYPIKNDKFLLKLEFKSLFIIWYVTHNLMIGYSYVFGGNYDSTSIFVINSLRNFAIILVYAYVTCARKKITSKEVNDIMKDFDSFMYCHVSFTFFREYIKTYHEEDYKLLSFWIEYHLYKKQTQAFQETIKEMYLKNEDQKVHTSDVKTLNMTLNTQDRQLIYSKEDELRDMADHIFQDYFCQIRSNTNSPVLTQNFYMNIELPVDIYEKIEEAYKINFNVENLIEIFDEAHSYVTTKLFNLFLLFSRNEKEYKKLERVVFYIDFYEIKRIALS
jgi:hypothetical protein